MRPIHTLRLYKNPCTWEKWKRIAMHREACSVVKGTNRRVIVVRSPDQLFEEAIFVLKENEKPPQDASLVMEQARRAAGEYLKKCGAGSVKRKPLNGLLVFLLCLIVSCAAAGAIWFFLL